MIVKGYSTVTGWLPVCTVVVSLRDMFGCAAGNVSECVQEEKGSSCCSELEKSYTGGLS